MTTSPPSTIAPARVSAPPKILGRLLVDADCATAGQVDAALRLQPGSGLRIGEIMVRQGWVDAETVARMLARQLGLDYAPPPLTFEWAATRLLPADHARAAGVVPLTASPRRLRLAMADPLDLEGMRDVGFRTGRRIDGVVVSPRSLARALDAAYGGEVDRLVATLDSERPDIDDDTTKLARAASAAPVVRVVDGVLDAAAEAGASDVHFEPQDDGLRVRLRIDGVLRTTHSLPPGVRDAVLSRLKILADMDIAVRRRPQDGGFVLQREGGELALRVSTLPAGGAEKAVVRILDPGRVPGGLDALGLAPDQEARIRRVLRANQGVLLATGPTGSGKSSTLQAALAAVDRDRLNVVALEDPVEYRVPGVVHVQMASRAGLTFASALRAVLRQDPDVVMVGEIRDRETAEIAMAAAVTGHLVLSSLHTTDAAGAVARLLHMGVPPYLVAAGLSGVVAQRLVRRVCPLCRGRACERCREGFTGRTGVFQVLVMDARLREAVATGAATTTLRRLAREGGMGTLADDARRVVAEGITLPHEVSRVLRGDPGAALPCEGCGSVVPNEARVCPWCGRSRGAWCRCGVRTRPGWRFCPDCARRVT